LAVDGRSGSNMSDTTPQNIEIDPKIKNTYIHLGSPELICPTAYPINPPNMVASPFVQ